jgi:hypothetical protein
MKPVVTRGYGYRSLFAELHQSVMNEDEGGTVGLNFPHFQAII